MVITPAHVSIILKKENFWIELRVLGFLGWDTVSGFAAGI